MIKYLLICFFFFSISLRSQRPPYKEFNIDNGLPSNMVRCVFKDSRGLIWIGTHSGLVRYDGKNFYVFDESNGLAANEVWSIVEDGFGNLWFGTYGKGVVKYNGKSFTYYNTLNGLAGNKIRRMFYSKKMNRIFIGTENGLSIYNGFTFQNTAGIPNKGGTIVMDITSWNDSIYVTNHLFKMAVLSFNHKSKSYRLENRISTFSNGRFLSAIPQHDQIIVATSLDGLQVFNHHFEILDSIKAPLIWKMEEGDEHDLYMASWNISDEKGGLYKFDGTFLKDLTQEWKLPSTVGWSVFYDKVEKQLWLSTLDKGLIVINLNKEIEIFTTPSEGEKSTIYTTVFKDRYGRLWLGAQDNIYVYDKNKLIKHYQAEELKRELLDFARRHPENTYSWVLDPDKNVFDEKKSEFIATKGFRINQFVDGNDGKLWVSASFGIFRLTKDFQIDFFDFEEGGHIIRTSGNKILYGVTYGKMYEFFDKPKPDKHTFHSFFKSDTPRNLTRMLQNDKDIWFTSFSEGLFHWQEEGNQLIKRKGHFIGENFSDVEISKDQKLILNEKNSRIWIVSKHGDDSLIVEKKLVPNIDFNGTSALFHLCFGDYLIIGTNKGINILKNDKVIYFLNYEEGLPSLQFKDAFIDENNLLWVLSDTYLFSLNLNLILKKKEIPIQNVRIKEVSYLKNKAIKHGDEYSKETNTTYLKVPYDLAAMEISFYANDIYRGSKALYRYRLIDKFQSGSKFESEGKMKVIGWAPGKYQVILEGKNLSTGKFYQSGYLEIEILPPFYASLWFRLTAFFLLACGIILFAKQRIKAIRTEEQEKTALKQKILETKMEALQSQMNPHFTFNALNSIQYFFLKNQMQEGLHFLSHFSKLIRQTMENAAKESILLADEMDYIQQYIEIQQLRFPEIKVTWEISETVNIHGIRIPPMILQPLIENVFDHAFDDRMEMDPKIEISMNTTNRGFEIKITDNGIGFESSKKRMEPVSRGIFLIEERIKWLNTALGKKEYFLMITDKAKGGKGKNGTEALFVLPL
jgi:ligand-binding sensor domain-containing protein